MNRPLRWTLAAATFAFVAVIAFGVTKLVYDESHRVNMLEPEKVAGYVHAILEANRLNYTLNVVEKLNGTGIEAIEHWQDEKGVPLPAQFLLESGRLVAKKDLKFSFRLASLTPIYVWNSANSDFEQQGLVAVAQNPDKPHTGFVHLNGGRYFQAIYADRAVTQGCVNCHNSHPNSPRRDFKLNDVMGGVIITIPMGD